MTELQELDRKLEYLKKYMSLKIDDKLPRVIDTWVLFYYMGMISIGRQVSFECWYRITTEYENDYWHVSPLLRKHGFFYHNRCWPSFIEYSFKKKNP